MGKVFMISLAVFASTGSVSLDYEIDNIDSHLSDPSYLDTTRVS